MIAERITLSWTFIFTHSIKEGSIDFKFLGVELLFHTAISVTVTRNERWPLLLVKGK